MHRIIMSGNRLDDIDKAEYMSLVTGEMGEDTLVYSMKTLTALLEKYYEKKVIVSLMSMMYLLPRQTRMVTMTRWFYLSEIYLKTC